MARRLLPLILISLLAAKALAVSVLSSGPSAQTIEQGVSAGIFDSVTQHAEDWVAKGMDKVGNWALKTLFGIYDKYIGTFLIYIPNLASPSTYSALVGNLGAVNTGANAVQVVLNILQITSGTGLFILIVGFVIDTGQRSSGLWNRFVDPNMVIGFVASFLCLFGWPTILSYLTTGVTAMGYYIYNQNTLRTSGVLEGFQNIDINAGGGSNSYQLSQYDFRGNFITIQGITWNLIYLIALGLVVLGFYNCYSAFSAGESQKGNHRFFQAMGGLILILGMPTLVHVLISKGADTIGNQVVPGQTTSTYSLQGLIQDNGIQFPQQPGQASPNIGTAGNTAAPVPTSRLAEFSAGLLKCGVAIWGLIICFAVIFAKFFQVLNLWVLFVLGPIFIGCLGHPATVPIFWGAARYFVKLLLYSVIWAITLVGLYLIPNINWGVETIGVNSLLTAVAVLAGLQLITNVQEFASLFTTFSGANLKGEGYKEFTRDMKGVGGGMNEARLGAFGGMKKLTGETSQAMAAATGATVGSVIPAVGTASGALTGQRFMKGMNAIAKVGSLGGRNRPSGDPDNPISNALRKFSGDVISRGLKKDSQNAENFTPSEREKHKLVSDYAKKLQRGKEGYRPKPGNQGKGTA
jgi:hypothetical protein